MVIAIAVVVVAGVGRQIASSTAGIADAGAAIGHDVEDGGVLDDAAADGDTEITAAALGGIGARDGDGAEVHRHDGRHGYREESRVAHGAFSIHLAGRFRPLATRTSCAFVDRSGESPERCPPPCDVVEQGMPRGLCP